MRHISSTPFGRRPVTAGLLAAQRLAEGDSLHPANKWQVLRDLSRARKRLNLSDRALSLLTALVSFWREDEISAEHAIVFPSNQTLSLRAHGMAESTLRRHLAALIAAGLIMRHDSPNGKRYANQRPGDEMALGQAFGFDLSPLARRSAEIADLAEEEDKASAALKRHREAIVLMLRDCDKLIAYASGESLTNWDALKDAVALSKRALRRQMDARLLSRLSAHVEAILTEVKAAIYAEETKKSSGNDSQNGRHKHSSTINLNDLESAEKQEMVKESFENHPEVKTENPKPPQDLPLAIVLEACPEIKTYALNGLTSWADLIQASAFVHKMIGINQMIWHEAQEAMGPANAAVTLACILQSYERIKNPAGYLRSLSKAARAGQFKPEPMVLALLRAVNEKAA